MFKGVLKTIPNDFGNYRRNIFMGRYYYSKKETVNNYNSISVKFLKQHNQLVGYCSGGIKWTRGGQKAGSVSYHVDIMRPGDEYIRFKYTTTIRDTGEKIDQDYKVRLVSTKCNYESSPCS